MDPSLQEEGQSEKDTRGRNRVEQREKTHHRDQAISGPDFIQKRANNADESDSRKEDPIGVPDSDGQPMPHCRNTSDSQLENKADYAKSQMRKSQTKGGSNEIAEQLAEMDMDEEGEEMDEQCANRPTVVLKTRKKKASKPDEKELANSRPIALCLREPVEPSLLADDVVKRIRHHLGQDVPHSFLPIHPPTLVLDPWDTKKVLGCMLDTCAFVRMETVGSVEVFHGPRCARPAKDAIVEGWKAWLREDMSIFTPLSSSPPTVRMTACQACSSKRPGMALLCGHFFCGTCWLKRIEACIRDNRVPVPCLNGACISKLSYTAAWCILSDAGLALYRDSLFDALRMKEGTVSCLRCPALLVHDNSHNDDPSTVRNAYCALCETRTCTRCGWEEHLPLTCRDHERYLELLQETFVDKRNGQTVDSGGQPNKSNWRFNVPDLQVDMEKPHEAGVQEKCPHCGERSMMHNTINNLHFCSSSSHGLEISSPRALLSPERLLHCIQPLIAQACLRDTTLRRINRAKSFRANAKTTGKREESPRLDYHPDDDAPKKLKERYAKLLKEAGRLVEMSSVRKELSTRRNWTKEAPRKELNALLLEYEGKMREAFEFCIEDSAPMAEKVLKLEDVLRWKGIYYSGMLK